MLTNQKCPSHTNQPIRVNLERPFQIWTPYPFSTPPSLHKLVFSHSVYPNQYFFSNERPLADLNFFRKRNEPKTSNRFQLLKFVSTWAFFARLYVSVPILSREFGRIDMYLSYSTKWRHGDVIITCDSYVHVPKDVQQSHQAVILIFETAKSPNFAFLQLQYRFVIATVGSCRNEISFVEFPFSGFSLTNGQFRKVSEKLIFEKLAIFD